MSDQSTRLGARLRGVIHELGGDRDDRSDEELDRLSLALAYVVAEILEVVMAGIDDLNAAVQQLQASVTAENTELANVASNLQTATQQLADLQAQVAATGNVSAQDLEDLATTITGVAQSASAAVSAAQAPAAPAGGTAAPAGGSAPDPTAGGAAPSGGASPSASEPTQSVYTFDGDPSTVDATVWPSSGFETTDTPPKLLFYYSGDTGDTPGATNGDGVAGAWHLYTGAVQPVQAAAADPSAGAAEG